MAPIDLLGNEFAQQQQQQQQQQQLLGLLGQGALLGSLFGSYPQPPPLPRIRCRQYGVKRHLSFFAELREEIDNWLKS